MTEIIYCTQCGTALRADDRFCGSCGQPVALADATEPPAALAPEPAAPPAVVAASPVAPPPPPPPPLARSAATQSGSAPAAPQRRKASRAEKRAAKKGGAGGRILIAFVGLLLVFFALQGPVLSVAGVRTVGTVERVTRADEEDHRYNISYSYTAGGKARSGSYSMQTFNTSRLPGRGASISLRYLPAASFISAPEDQARFSIATLVLLGLGGLLMFGAVKRR